jgi:uncharacterized membrane protein YgdD (TMEM256/DUF423 family)
MHKGFLKMGTMLAALSVILGAFAAHTIKAKVTADALAIFETGVRYQMYHAFAILITGIIYKEFTNKKILLAGKFFMFGILFFSGSLYLLTYIKTIAAEKFLWVGAITPFGGAFFIAGWLILCSSFFNKKQ